jgi:hypothetical protein
MTLKGHANTVTGLRVSPDGTHLLSNAMVRAAPPCPAPPVLQVEIPSSPGALCASASQPCDYAHRAEHAARVLSRALRRAGPRPGKQRSLPHGSIRPMRHCAAPAAGAHNTRRACHVL